MPKKFQFLLVAIFLTAGLIVLVFLPQPFQLPWVVLVSLLAFILSGLLLRDEMAGIELITLLALPTLFTLAVGMVLYYFSSFSLAFRTVFLTLYAISYYLMMLSENIFNVGRERPIPLLKAAGTVSYLLTLLTAFLLFTVIYKTDWPPFWQIAGIGLMVFILALQSLWTVVLGSKLNDQVLQGSILLTILMLELTLGLSFMPFESFFRALALSTGFYVFIGTAYNYLRKTLKERIFVEYAVVAAVVIFFLAML